MTICYYPEEEEDFILNAASDIKEAIYRLNHVIDPPQRDKDKLTEIIIQLEKYPDVLYSILYGKE